MAAQQEDTLSQTSAAVPHAGHRAQGGARAGAPPPAPSACPAGRVQAGMTLARRPCSACTARNVIARQSPLPAAAPLLRSLPDCACPSLPCYACVRGPGGPQGRGRRGEGEALSTVFARTFTSSSPVRKRCNHPPACGARPSFGRSSTTRRMQEPRAARGAGTPRIFERGLRRAAAPAGEAGFASGRAWRRPPACGVLRCTLADSWLARRAARGERGVCACAGARRRGADMLKASVFAST